MSVMVLKDLKTIFKIYIKKVASLWKCQIKIIAQKQASFLELNCAQEYLVTLQSSNLKIINYFTPD